MTDFINRYRKGLLAVVAAVASVLTVVLTGGSWSAVDWVAIVIPVLAAFGVVLTPNQVTSQQYKAVAQDIASAPVEDTTANHGLAS